MSLSTEARADLIRSVESFTADLIKEFRDELERQGHKLTGSLSNSFEFRISESRDQIISVISFNDYGEYVDRGVMARDIPYSGRTGAGGKSKYIQGLIRFFQLRGVGGDQAVRAAFATAAVHKREGMPTRASNRFSSVGTRKGFIDRAIESELPDVILRMENKFGDQLQIRVDNLFDNALRI